MSSDDTDICQYLLVKSIFNKYFLPLSLRNTSSAVVMGSVSNSVILFNFWKSTHTMIEPSFFSTMMTRVKMYRCPASLSGAIGLMVPPFDIDILSSTVIFFLGLGWFLLRVSLLQSTFISLLLVRLLLKHPIRLIITLVNIVNFVLVAPLVLDLTPSWSSAFQSGSGNIGCAPCTFPIITG